MIRRYSLGSRIDHGGRDHPLEHVDLRRAEVLHQPEVEERHLAAGLEEVVARVRVAVEGVEAVQAAEDETEDRLGGEVALGLRPRQELLERVAGRQLGRQHP